MNLTYQANLKLKISIPKSLQLLADIFQRCYFDLYIVGGAVRDSLYNHVHGTDFEIKDYDLCTSAPPELVIRMLQHAQINVYPKGIEYGTVAAVIDGVEFEITTFRKDGEYTDGRRPNSVELGTIEQDSVRRDLYINALYYNIEKEIILDFNCGNGIDDIAAKQVRFIGDFKDRINEDRIRALRYIRFCSAYGADPDINILEFIMKNGIDGVSQERITDEFLKGLSKSKDKVVYFVDLYCAHLFRYIFPEEKVVLNFTPESLNHVSNELIIYTLTRYSKDIRNLLNKAKFSNKIVNRVMQYKNIVEHKSYRKLISDVKTVDEKELLVLNEIYNYSDFRPFDFCKVAKLQNTESKEAIDLGLIGKEVGDYLEEKDKEKVLECQ